MNQSENFGAQRLLIVGGKPHVVQVLRQVLGIIGVKNVPAVAESVAAIDLLRTQSITAILCDESASQCGRESFARAARQSAGVLNPLIPIFLVCGGPRRRDVETARDLGFTDVLTRPVSAATIMRKLKLALGRPRPFIAAGDFFGPDRRSPSRSGIRPNDRRKRKPRQVKIGAPAADDGDQVLV